MPDVCTPISTIAPGTGVVAIVAADADLTRPIRALYVGSTGAVKLTAVDGTVATFASVPAGMVLDVACVRVWSTGTTAGDFTGIY